MLEVQQVLEVPAMPDAQPEPKTPENTMPPPPPPSKKKKSRLVNRVKLAVDDSETMGMEMLKEFGPEWQPRDDDVTYFEDGQWHRIPKF